MKKHFRSVCLYLIIIICTGVILASIWNFPNACKSYFPETNTILYPDSATAPEPVNAEIDENGEYRPIEKNPGLVFTPDHPYDIQSIKLTFDVPTEADIGLELYYAGKDGKFSSKKGKKTTIPQHSSEFYCNLDARDCYSLKICINGAVDIQSVHFSPNGIVYVIENPSWFVVPLIALIILIIAVVLCVIDNIRVSRAAAASATDGPVNNKPFIVGFLVYYIVVFLILYSLGYHGCLHRIDELMTRSRFLKKTVIESYQAANHHP